MCLSCSKLNCNDEIYDRKPYENNFYSKTISLGKSYFSRINAV